MLAIFKILTVAQQAESLLVTVKLLPLRTDRTAAYRHASGGADQ